MNKKKKWIIVIALALVVVIWMVFSTSWIASAQNDIEIILGPAVSREFMGATFMDDDVVKKDFTQTDTIFETIHLAGFIYNLSYATDEEATRSVILSSPERSYQIQVEEFRDDSPRKWYEANVADQTPKLNTKFDFEFTPLTLKDGTYSILLQVEENGEPVARAATGYVIEKVNGHSTLLYGPSKPVEAIGEANEWANAGFSSVKGNNDNTIDLLGWAMVNGVDSTQDTEVCLEVFNGDELVGTYSTTKECILYIAEYYDNPGYYTAGFRASIPGVLTEDLVVRVYVKYEGEYYKCGYHFVPDEDMANLVSVMDEG